MNISRLGLTALSVAFAVGAAAQSTTSSDRSAVSGSTAANGQFMSSDTNKDGRISKSEAEMAKGTLGSSFTTLDSDHDGYLSQTEFGKWDSTSNSGAKDGQSRERMTPSTNGAQGTDHSASPSGYPTPQSTSPDQSGKSANDAGPASGNAR